jgi:hypothetical protein
MYRTAPSGGRTDQVGLVPPVCSVLPEPHPGFLVATVTGTVGGALKSPHSLCSRRRTITCGA